MTDQDDAVLLIEAITAGLRRGALHYDQQGNLLATVEAVVQALLSGPVTITNPSMCPAEVQRFSLDRGNGDRV